VIQMKPFSRLREKVPEGRMRETCDGVGIFRWEIGKHPSLSKLPLTLTLSRRRERGLDPKPL
jgi:hypothetical protein